MLLYFCRLTCTSCTAKSKSVYKSNSMQAAAASAKTLKTESRWLCARCFFFCICCRDTRREFQLSVCLQAQLLPRLYYQRYRTSPTNPTNRQRTTTSPSERLSRRNRYLVPSSLYGSVSSHSFTTMKQTMWLTATPVYLLSSKGRCLNTLQIQHLLVNFC